MAHSTRDAGFLVRILHKFNMPPKSRRFPDPFADHDPHPEWTRFNNDMRWLHRHRHNERVPISRYNGVLVSTRRRYRRLVGPEHVPRRHNAAGEDSSDYRLGLYDQLLNYRIATRANQRLNYDVRGVIGGFINTDQSESYRDDLRRRRR